jgi:hypothetical protein
MFNDYCRAMTAQVISAYYFAKGMNSYGEEFLRPLVTATSTFTGVEAGRFFTRSPEENLLAYSKLLGMNSELAGRYSQGVLETLERYGEEELARLMATCYLSLFDPSGRQLADHLTRQSANLRRVVEEYPEMIDAIEPEYGFHFEKDSESHILGTDRFELRRVAPSQPGVAVDPQLKPVLIVPPFVLGANILAFLPGEGKSYAHAFANQGIPTYIRILKPIATTPAVQVMTPEEDALDTRLFCEKLVALHGRPVTLNGYCQGGFSTLCNLLSGRLDGLVDALITCVTPIDGTRSRGLGNFLRALPPEFNDLAYGTKTLANGNKIADGHLMGWIYKLKSIEDSGPISTFFRDMLMLSPKEKKPVKISKTVAALNYWLQRERSDLPLPITEMSFRSYTTPISSDGTLPVTLFGEKLNIRAINEKGIPWLLCYGESDDLVEKEVALAPLDFVEVEVTPFPKGHVAIATSWSHPDSACPLDGRFGTGQVRGPVGFHLDLADAQQAKAD